MAFFSVFLSGTISAEAGLSIDGTKAETRAESNSQIKLIDYQVPFSAVAGLPFNQPEETLSYGDDRLQFFKRWPARVTDGSKPLGTIIFIHGGCWLNAFDYRHGKGFMSALAERGFDSWAVEYRRTGDEGGGWPGTYEDIKKGINFLLDKVNGPVYLLGHSAGGHLAALYGTEFSPAKVKSIIGLGAITDVVAYSNGSNSCQTAAPKFMGGTYKQKQAEYQSATLIGKDLKIKTILLQGKEDSIVPFKQANLKGAKTILVEKAGHFDWIYPNSKGFNILIETIMENR